MATYITLRFNDNITYKLSTSSFLFKNSKLLPLFEVDIDEDNTIPILCLSTYVLDENERYLFNDKHDLSFMFTLLPNKFIEVCKFLDIICYENIDTLFSKQFITYVMTNLKEEINIIKYFMQNEIRSILVYNDNKYLVKSCTHEFYFLYLSEYKEEVIKYNRIDIYNLSPDESEYYKYIHKYDNHLTIIVTETREYNDYITNINNNLCTTCNTSNNINKIKDLVEQGANINSSTALHHASHQKNNLGVIKYLVEQGANVNLQDNYGNTALQIASFQNDNLEAVKYLVEHGANVNLQTNTGYTALHYASFQNDNLEAVKYLVEQGANIHLQNNNGSTALHFASNKKNNLEVIKYLVEQGANVNLQVNNGRTALHLALQNDNKQIANYLKQFN